MQQAMMDLQNFKQGKGQSVQDYTLEFKKKDLVMGIPLYTQETLLKYIGGLHGYLKHTILMFNPNNLDELCVQVTHIELKRKNVADNYSKKPFKIDGNKFKGKGKGKQTTTIKKEGEKPSCSHYKKRHVTLCITLLEFTARIKTKKVWRVQG